MAVIGSTLLTFTFHSDLSSGNYLQTRTPIIMPGIIKTVLSILSLIGPDPNSTILALQMVTFTEIVFSVSKAEMTN